MTVVGIDPSKELLALSLEGGKAQLRNSPSELEAWSKSLEPDTVVGIEATGRLHRAALAALAAAGIECYLLNPLHVSRYIRALRPSVKTDRSDAVMIARYLDRERDMLVAYKMPTAAIQELKDLLSYRETVMEKRVALRQSHSEQTFKLQSQAELEKAFAGAVREIDQRIKEIARQSPLYKRLLTIDGVGPMSAAALTWLFDAHEFRDSDQAVAYVGLDVSVRQSGKWVGQSKLTKRGPAFVRTFLFNGANSLRKIQTLRPLFEHHEAKKYAPTQVNTIVARKLLRVAFAIATKPEAAFKRENLLPQLRG